MCERQTQTKHQSVYAGSRLKPTQCTSGIIAGLTEWKYCKNSGIVVAEVETLAMRRSCTSRARSERSTKLSHW